MLYVRRCRIFINGDFKMNNKKNIITKIEIQKRNKDRVNIFINEQFAFACSAELIYTHSLCKGKIIDMSYLKEIIFEDNCIKCKGSALRIIERTYKTEKQIRDKLSEKEYDEKVINKTLEFLKQYKFVDDERFLEAYIKDKLKSQGKNKIKYALINKGISEELIERKLINIDKSSEQDRALKLAEKKLEVLMKNESDARKIYKKLGDYLVRNGYNLDIVQDILNNLVKEELNNTNRKKQENKETDKKVNKLYELAEKRYELIIKSESDKIKIRKKLSDYILRRGYEWEEVKSALNCIMKDI
jgi:regulatory protein